MVIRENLFAVDFIAGARFIVPLQRTDIWACPGGQLHDLPLPEIVIYRCIVGEMPDNSASSQSN
jgi:hypothetical protein